MEAARPGVSPKNINFGPSLSFASRFFSSVHWWTSVGIRWANGGHRVDIGWSFGGHSVVIGWMSGGVWATGFKGFGHISACPLAIGGEP